MTPKNVLITIMIIIMIVAMALGHLFIPKFMQKFFTYSEDLRRKFYAYVKFRLNEAGLITNAKDGGQVIKGIVNSDKYRLKRPDEAMTPDEEFDIVTRSPDDPPDELSWIEDTAGIYFKGRRFRDIIYGAVLEYPFHYVRGKKDPSTGKFVYESRNGISNKLLLEDQTHYTIVQDAETGLDGAKITYELEFWFRIVNIKKPITMAGGQYVDQVASRLEERLRETNRRLSVNDILSCLETNAKGEPILENGRPKVKEAFKDSLANELMEVNEHFLDQSDHANAAQGVPPEEEDGTERRWGIRILGIRFVNIIYPEKIIEAKNAQLIEREKAKGVRAAAEGLRDAEVIRAEGERDAITTIAEGEATRIRKIAKANMAGTILDGRAKRRAVTDILTDHHRRPEMAIAALQALVYEKTAGQAGTTIVGAPGAPVQGGVMMTLPANQQGGGSLKTPSPEKSAASEESEEGTNRTGPQQGVPSENRRSRRNKRRNRQDNRGDQQ